MWRTEKDRCRLINILFPNSLPSFYRIVQCTSISCTICRLKISNTASVYTVPLYLHTGYIKRSFIIYPSALWKTRETRRKSFLRRLYYTIETRIVCIDQFRVFFRSLYHRVVFAFHSRSLLRSLRVCFSFGILLENVSTLSHKKMAGFRRAYSGLLKKPGILLNMKDSQNLRYEAAWLERRQWE